ncbi:NUDIX domain-containing protein [Nocardia sp. CNY236]|uniref:NUDIX hydrolase n=1 Tax=Nocardia sp. CNY236 TaxID=1169152 RepID=UPI0003FD1A71|nr:NUDIX domain-containing protein [Nocardia sp. CNY236]
MAITAEGSNIIIRNSDNQILLFLRDDKPDIPCPGMWALLGGYREPGETPKEGVIREIEEEIGVVLDPAEVEHHVTRERRWGLLEHTFRTCLDLDLSGIVLTRVNSCAGSARPRWLRLFSDSRKTKCWPATSPRSETSNSRPTEMS